MVGFDAGPIPRLSYTLPQLRFNSSPVGEESLYAQASQRMDRMGAPSAEARRLCKVQACMQSDER